MKLFQLDFIRNQLVKYGKIDRNTCLSRYITRLSAYIYDLKELGWQFKQGYDEHRNYVYYVTKSPKKIERL